MRTKTLLLSAAALVAGLLSSQAQSNVYSANVVGYAQVVVNGNAEYTMVANPFDDGAGNYLTNICPTNLYPVGSQCLTWSPSGGSYTTIKRLASGWNASPQLPPGTGFFLKNGNAGAPTVTNTFVGSVIVQNFNSVTNPIPLNYSMQGSPIPYNGNVCIATQTGGDTNMNFGATVSAGSQILIWSPSGGSYSTIKRLAGSWNTTVTISPGQAFFLFNKNGPATNVVETLNLQ